MKKIYLTSILMLSLVFVNCSKDDDSTAVEVVAEENPLQGYLTATGFNQKTTNFTNAGDYEFGFSFKPSVSGSITALLVKIPDVHVGLRVTIWDKETATVLRTELIDVTSSGVEIKKNISSLSLTANKEYWITFNSNDWYDRRKTDGTNISYPVTVGNIQVTGYGYKSGTTQALPTSFPVNYYAGDLSFVFQKF